ncbi:MAG TPA: ABC transporter permease [Candidatus Limnocylindrales bacterium]
MTSLERAAPHAASAEPVAAVRFLLDAWTVASAELRKLAHDPTEVATRAVQPILWLVVFGQVIAQSRVIETGSVGYMDFLAPGVLAQSALFSAIFFGIAVIWERDLGVLHKYLVSPASREALVTGKALAGGLRALVQAFVVYLAAVLIGIHLRWELPSLVGVALVVVLGAAGFATFSLIVACLVRTRERFMGIGQVLTMPLFFASNAIYPISLMPGWLQVFAHLNPLTYQVDALRALMIDGGPSTYPIALDIAVLAGTVTVLVAIASRLYPRLAQ